MLYFSLLLLMDILLFTNVRFVKPSKLGDSKEEKTQNNTVAKSENTGFYLTEKSKKELLANRTNFNNDRIQLFFNKRVYSNSNFIKLQSVGSCFKLEDFALIRSNDNKVEILFKESLKKNTTYIISFLKTSLISVDGDTLDDFDVVFSTGDKIDDYVMSGSVIDLFNNSPVPNSYVFMYKLTDTEIKAKRSNRNILNSNVPYYFTKCDNSGNYKFKNISKGTYFICAGEIDISNFVSNSELYRYGFLKDFVVFSDDKHEFCDVVVRVLKNNVSNFKITGNKFLNNKFIIETNGEIESFSIRIIDKFSDDYIGYNTLLSNASKVGDKNNEIVIDNKVIGLILGDILPCFIEINNKFGEKISCNIDVKLDSNFSTNEYYLAEKKEGDLVVKPVSNDLTIDGVVNFQITSRNNILSIDKNKVKIIISDKYFLNSSVIEDFTLIKKNDCFYIMTNKKVCDIVEGLKNKKWSKYSLLSKGDINIVIKIDEGAILYNDFNKNKSFFDSVLFLKDYSSIPVEVGLNFKHFRVQLLGKEFSIVKDITDSDTKGNKNFIFEKVPYGEYKIRYFAWNGDKWNLGNIFKNETYDYIDFYKDTICLKSNLVYDKLFIN